MYSCFRKTGLGAFAALFLCFSQKLVAQTCPSLNPDATFTSDSCAPGLTPCILCPGEPFTLNVTGQGLQPGSCVNWYYGTTDTFNPYNGGGILLGCSEVAAQPPNPCNECPSILGILVDACGMEENNEILFLWSGSGFAVDSATLDFDAANNGPIPADADIGAGCNWQAPDSIALATVRAICPDAFVMGAGPGEIVPAGVPVVVFTSAGFDFSYTFNGSCPLAPVIYVLQNGCTRTIGAFSNGTSNGARQTTFALNCGCNWTTNYTCNALIGGDGAFVVDGGNPPIDYGNTGCNFPAIPGADTSTAVFVIAAFTDTIVPALCNNGPYWIVGVADSLPDTCALIQTNYLPFDVICPAPVLSQTNVCQNSGVFDLAQLADPLLPDGAWSGPGVNGAFFDPTGLSGPQALTFTPSVDCGVPATTTITVLVPQSAQLSLAGTDTICAGLANSFSIDVSDGRVPFTFIYSINGQQQQPETGNTAPFSFFIPPFSTAGSVAIQLDSIFTDGCPGTVSGADTIVILPAPAASIVSDTITLCNGQTDTVLINLSGPGPYTFQYAINNTPQPPVVTADTLYKIPVTATTGLTVFSLVSVSGGGCNGTVSGRYGISVAPIPTATLSGDTTICSGELTPLTINFTGSGPFIVEYTANGAPQKPDTSFFNPRVLLVNPNIPTFYKITGVAARGCPGTVSGQATVNVLPPFSASISGGGQICQNGAGTTVTVTFAGPGPQYTFVYSAQSGGNPPVIFPPITTTSNPYTFAVNPPIGTIYRLVSVSNGVCNGSFSGLAVVAVFTPSTATLSEDLTFCDSANTTLMVDFTGSGPFSLVYTVNNVTQPTVETFDDPYFIPVNITSTTTYELISIESPGCIGSITGNPDATVTINYAPSYTNLVSNCNLQTGAYTIEFDAVNATLPLTVLSGNGSFSGTHFTSDPIPMIQPYNIVFRDANNCGDITIAGPSTCNCSTNAGTMNLNPVSACVGSTLTVTHNGDQSLDSDDLLRFILHTSPALPVGQILGWSPTPSFVFGPGMQTNVTYYVSAVAGNPDGNGNADLNELCASVSQGTPVIFYDLPLGRIDSIGPVCPADTVLIPVILSGAPPFSFSYALNGIVQTAITNVATTVYHLSVPVGGPTLVTLGPVNDLFCANNTVDSFAVELVPSPQVSKLTLVCDFATQTYTVEFDVSGKAPFFTSGNAGFFNGNHFTSLPISTSLPYSISVTDANFCGQTTVSGVSNCVCPTQAGTMVLTAAEACAGAPITVTHQGNQMLEPDDVLGFVLHTLSGNVLGAVLGVQNQPVFNFNPATMSTETQYYISAIAGNDDGSGIVDLNDPCRSVSPGVPVLWHAAPTATIGASFDICPGGNVKIPVTFTGLAPFDFTYTNNGNPNTVNATQSTYSINATLLQSATFSAISITDQRCPGTAAGQAVVTVHQPPVIDNIIVSCAPDNESYRVEFDVLNADFTTLMVSGGVTGSFDPNTGRFTSDPIPAQTGYTAIVSDAWNCGLDSISGGANCACVTSAGLMDLTPLNLCYGDTAVTQPSSGFFLGAGDTLLYALVTTPAPNTWTIVATGNSPVFPFNPALIVPGQTYYIVALAGNKTPAGVDLTDKCFNYTLGPTVKWQPEAMAVLSADTDLCQGDTAMLVVSLSGNGPFNFMYSAGGIGQPALSTGAAQYLLPVAPASNTLYTLISLTANGCTGSVSGSAQVTVFPKPQILNVVQDCDLATETLTLRFSIGNGGAPNGPYTVNGIAGTLTDTSFVSQPIPNGLAYNIVVSTPAGCTAVLSGTVNCNCATNAGTLSPAGPLDVCLPGDAILQPNNDAVLESDDVLQYILYENAAILPAGILATSSTPQFPFQTGMATGQIYFISAIAGNSLPGGGIDPADPCLSVSPGIPIIFRNQPTATLAGDTTVCTGGNVRFRIQFTGTSPFKFVYAINNNPQTAIAAPQNIFTITSNNVQQNQVFTLISVEDEYCTGIVNGAYTVTIQQGPAATILSDTTICPGSEAVLALLLSGADSFDLTINGGLNPIQLNGVQNGATFTVQPSGTTNYTIGALTAYGNLCPAKPATGATVTIAPALSVNTTLSDYGGGFNISCPGENDGSITLTPAGGIAPVKATWSNGANALMLKNLAAGTYSVTLTDNIGCQIQDSFMLTASPGPEIIAESNAPVCFGERSGSITIQQVNGGVGPYTVSLNNQAGQTVGAFPFVLPNLAAGPYQLTVEDINGCASSVNVFLYDPPQLSVSLGPDTTIYFGDSILIEALVNSQAIDSFAWSPLAGLKNPDALLTEVKPAQSTVYKIWVRDTAGCRAEADILIAVSREKRVFIPNVFQPSSPNGNGILTVYAGPEVKRVRSFRVYDRWGECVFEKPDLIPNQAADGWDGRWRGKEAPPGVYLYVAELEYFDGGTEVVSGDVTVVR